MLKQGSGHIVTITTSLVNQPFGSISAGVNTGVDD